MITFIHSHKTFAGALALVLTLSLLGISIPDPTHADPITLIVAVIAIAAVGTGGVAVANVINCHVNVFWGCSENGRGGGGSGGGGGSSLGGGLNNRIGTQGNNNSGSNNSGDSSGPGGGIGEGAAQACTTSSANSCGMHGTGFINASGVCGATVPPDSSCPSPIIGSFYANPSRVDKGATSTLEWSVTNASVCTLTGGGLSLSNLGITASAPTNAITGDTTFTLNCADHLGPALSSQATVHLIPSYQEL